MLSSTLLLRQFRALFYKNLVVARRHWLLNFLRCLILPVAYGIFLAYGPTLFKTPDNFGVGTAIPIFRLEEHYNGKNPIVWVDLSGETGYIKGVDIMNHVMANFSQSQRAGVIEVNTQAEMFSRCAANAGGVSPCFITVSFDSIPTISSAHSYINYTIFADSGSYHVDVIRHSSDMETKVIPLQWGIDSAIIELTTSQKTPVPQELPFTWTSNDLKSDTNRIFFLSLMGSFGGVTFLLAFVGIAYQLTGGLALERATMLTSHMQAMGALDSARILSWYLSMVSLYFPTWIILALVWHAKLFVETNVGLMILINILGGLGLASWSCIFSVPFSKSPQLAAIFSTILALILGIIPLGIDLSRNTVGGPILSFFFPSMFYVFMIKDFAGFETNHLAGNLTIGDPQWNLVARPMIIAVSVGIVFWPCFSIYLERWVYGILNPSNTSFTKQVQKPGSANEHAEISLRNVQKEFRPSLFSCGSRGVVAIADLTLDIPSYGIFVLLGANGAGKSTTLSILGGLTKSTSGTVMFSGSTSRPPRGSIGIVPQKNVLFPELTCLEMLRIWNAIKGDGQDSDKDLEQLIHDCDLTSKMHEQANTLSGGQKRKLQLAIGLVGGSKIILVDECTSGVDPLSRRALWKTLTSYREERTIILTTHFLDEADFLADRIAVLAAPGKLIASDTPVALKRSMGGGYSVIVKFDIGSSGKLLESIRTVVPATAMTSIDEDVVSYHLKTRNTVVTAAVLRLIEQTRVENGIITYDVVGTTIEDIFLDLVAQAPEPQEILDAAAASPPPPSMKWNTALSTGVVCSPWTQALTIFYKRCLIFRRSWLAHLLALAIGISGAWWPIRYIQGGVASCAAVVPPPDVFFETWPPYLGNATVLASPPNLIAEMNASLPELFVNPFSSSFFNTDDPYANLPFNPFIPISDTDAFLNATFTAAHPGFGVQFIDGGISCESNTNCLISWSVSPQALPLFGITSNLFFNRAINATAGGASGPRTIAASFKALPQVSDDSLLSLQWLAIFGAAMVVFPTVFALYVAKERHSSVQAMHLSNGLSNPLGLWLGHLMFDSIFTVIIATVVAIVYHVARSKFQGVGYLWLIICLYGFATTLLSYITALVIKSPLGACAALIVYQFIIYLLYLTGYIVTYFSGNPQTTSTTMNIINFTVSLAAPINSLVRAAMVSINQFSLACTGHQVARGTALGGITRYGGPILYLICWILVLLLILAYMDSGIFYIRRSRSTKTSSVSVKEKAASLPALKGDVITEAEQALSFSNSDPLRVLGVSKSFKHNQAVDNVTFTIPHNSLFVMLGPNGAGKTTTIDIIRGNLKADSGDVIVNGTSVLTDLRKARVSFGVCPQFTAMDAQLSVMEHLIIYGRFRGLSGSDLHSNVHIVMEATGLHSYANRLATKLSGGNQRKLALAIALIGNPSVILVDEYSTGIDAKMKRELWNVLRQATSQKAVLLTTHSMEEASYLATKVGIISKRMLAIGTPDELESRSASYEVHFSCQTREEKVKVQSVMTRIPGSRMVDDVATRFEIPLRPNPETLTSVADIFDILSKEHDFPEYTVGKSSLETAFIRIINEDNSERVNTEVPAKKGKFMGIF